MAWVTPLIIGFVIAIALIATAALVYVKRAASNLNTTSNKLPVNLTPILFGAGRDQGKKTATPNLREFQLVSGQEGHTQHVNRRRKTVRNIYNHGTYMHTISEHALIEKKFIWSIGY